MKKLLKRLTSNVFRRINDYLLRNYPTVWRTRIHIVLPLALLAFAVLFAAGYFLPKNTFLEPLVDPIAPIEITQGNYFLIPFAFAVIAILYWGFTQYQYKFDEAKPLKVVATLLIYGIGLFVILGLDTTAFRLGTIVQTSTLMPENELKYVEDNDYFLYGFFPRDSTKKGHGEEYFKNDTIFKRILGREGTILRKRYDRNYLLELPDTSDISDRFYRPYVSSRRRLSNLSHQLDLSSQEKLSIRWNILDRADLLNLSNLSSVSYEAYRTDLSYMSDPSDQLYRFHVSYLSNLSDYKRFVRDNKVYQAYYKDSIFSKLDTIQFGSYGLDFSFKEFKYENLTFDIPQYFYPLEDGVRSVRHAQQYLGEGIIYRYFKIILAYLPFVLILFFSVSFLSQKNILSALVLGLVVFFVSNYFHSMIEDSEIQLEVYTSYRMAVLAVLSLIITSFSFFINRENRITNFFLHVFILAAIGTALIPIFIEKEAAKYGEDGIYYVKTWVFYLTAALCLIVPVLFSYLKGLPKSR